MTMRNSHGLPVITFETDRKFKPIRSDGSLTRAQLALAQPKLLDPKTCNCRFHSQRILTDELSDAFSRYGSMLRAVEELSYAPAGDLFAEALMTGLLAGLGKAFTSDDTRRRLYERY